MTSQHLINEVQNIFLSHKSKNDQQYLFDVLIADCNETAAKDLKKLWKELNNDTQFTHPQLKLNKGKIMNNPINLHLILTEHPAFKGKLTYNELNHQVYYEGKQITDLDTAQLRSDLALVCELSFKKNDVIDFASLVANNNKFHPIRNYLNSLKWDGEDRMVQFANLLCIQNTDINVAVLTNWLIASVARIMKPGCKVDTIPVFKGTTGSRKTSVLKALMHDEEWYTGEPIAFGTKDAKITVIGKWFVELAELSSLNKSDANTIKADITLTVDEFRAPYDRCNKKYPRQFVYIGTTNDDEFLNDPTSNRRFLILPNYGIIDVDAIAEMRDQLWAQATHLYNTGNKWYLDRNQEAIMAEIASQYEIQDCWKEDVAKFVSDKDRTTTQNILEHLCKTNGENRDKSRVVKIMQQLRWTAQTTRIDGIAVAGWTRPAGKPVPVGKPIILQGEVVGFE